jgi:type I restriction enzyme S subunit
MNKLRKLIDELCPEGVKYLELGKVCEITNNKRKAVKSSDRKKGDIPYYGANNIQDFVSGYTHEGEYILIAEDGTNDILNYSIQYVNSKFWANNHVHVVSALKKINNKYIYYSLKTINFQPYLSGGERAKLTKAKMLQIKIPVPPLEIQNIIVEKLDKLDKLVSDISKGLTSQLKMRQDQYKHYMNKLLTFELEGVNE